MKKFLSISFFVFLIVIGCLLIFTAINISSTEKSAMYWPTTKGVVQKAEVVQIQYRHPKRPARYRYAPRWTYAFYLSDKQYSSYKTTFGTVTSYANKADAEVALSRHPVGNNVNVVYDPQNPDKAALELSNSRFHYWLLILAGTLCSMFGLIRLTYLLKSNR